MRSLILMKLQLTFMILAMAGLAVAETDADFGVTSITSFEIGRVAAFCSDDASDGRVVEPCVITFQFHSARGALLKQSIVTLTPGTGGFLDLRGTEAGAGGSPVEIVPCVKVGRGAAFGSFQTFDIFTFRTHVLANWGDRPTFRSGEQEFGPAGITVFDLARVSAFCSDELTRTGLPPDPCDVVFEFHDLRGRLVKQSSMTLQPGTGGSQDLRGAEAMASGSPVEIIPCFKVGRGAAVGTVRMIDTLTGRTNQLVYPAALAQ